MTFALGLVIGAFLGGFVCGLLLWWRRV